MRRRTRAWAIDATVAIAVAVVLLVAATASAGGANDRPLDGWAVALLLTIAAVTLLRRRWPVQVLLAATVLIFVYYMRGHPAVGLELPLAAPAFSVAVVGRWRLASVWALVVTALAYGTRLRLGQHAATILGLQLPTTLAVLFGAIAWGDAVRSRGELRAEQARRVAAVRREADQAIAQRLADQRLSLARDLHDVLGHTLSVVTLHAGIADEAIADGDLDAAAVATGAISEASGSAMRDLRGTVSVLRGDVAESLHPVGDLTHLDALLQRTRAAGLTVVEHIAVAPDAVTTTTALVVHRVVQESLTNVLRHAGATTVWVEVTLDGADVVVRIADDGRGAGSSALARGSGLQGMSERVSLVGGACEFGAAPEGGFQVSARIPR